MTSFTHKQSQKQQAKPKQKRRRSQCQSKAQEQHQIDAEKVKLCVTQKTFARNSPPLETTRPTRPIAIGSIAEVKEDIHAAYADSEQRRGEYTLTQTQTRKSTVRCRLFRGRYKGDVGRPRE